MNFKIFVKNLSERVLHIAKNEAEKKGYVLNKLMDINETSILNLSCDNVSYIRNLAGTLETGYQTNVLSVKDNDGRDIDFYRFNENVDVLLYNRDTLTIQREEYAATY